MFPNSDSTEIQSNETNDCTASRRRRVRRLSVALLAAITLVVGITAAGQLSVAEAAGTVVAVDDAGADDEPGQKDLNWLSIDYGAPGATALTVKWGWDDTATSGANTRDAGSLFDTDGDGFANYSLYVTVATDGSYTTQLYSCSADNRTDRCAGPALVGTFASTATVAVPADSDPFGVPGSADYDADHVAGNTCRATTGCYTQDTVATADIRLADFGNPADAFLLNVCSYPSGEPNSDPSDCVFAPNNGFLTIVKVASPNDGTSFPFNASEQSESNDSSWTITGSGSQSLISYGPTTTLDVNEAVPAGWKLDSASCTIQTATPTATGTSTGTGVDNLEIRSGLETICTFNDTKTNPLLEVVKSSTTASITAAGQVVPYRFAVSNKGNVALTGITVTDPKCDAAAVYVSGDTDTDSKLDLSETWIYSCSHTVSQAELDAGGSLSNTVTADSNESGPDTDTLLIPVSQNPVLSLAKSATPLTYSTVGQSISYSYLVSNGGNVRLAGPVTVADDKATVTCPALGDGFLDPGESTTCSASYSITQADLNNGSVTNTAKASAGGIDSNEDKATVNAIQHETLSLDKSALPATYDSVGDVIAYSYLVTNTGNVRLAGPVTVADDKATVVCPNVNTVGNNDGFLDPAESVTCTASYSITQADLNAGSVTNTAKASAGGIDSNEDKATVDAVRHPSLVLDKTASPTSADAVGDVISYTYLVRNDGNVRLAGPVTVADDKATVSCPALSTIGNNDGFLDPGELLTCNASYAITQADLNRGSVTNTAKASAGGTDSNEDKATVTVTPPPPPPVTPAPPIATVAAAPVIDLSITKADRPDPVFVGGRLTYTLTVRNLGPDKATNVRVADALPAGTTFLAVATTQGTCTGGRVVHCSLGEVMSGGRATITIIVRPTETGVLLNTATVVGDQSESNTANNRATAPTLVRGPIAPPVASCPAFQVQPRSLSAGQRGVVRVIVTDKGRGVSGVRILVKGPGLNKAALTNGSGRVAISVRPPRTGIVEIRMTNQPSRCSTRRIGVVGVFLPPPVTG